MSTRASVPLLVIESPVNLGTADQATLSDGSVDRALGDDLFAPGSEDRKNVSSSLRICQCLLYVNGLITLTLALMVRVVGLG